jgi:hypothetical protein
MKRLMLIWIPALLVLVVLTGLPTIRAHADDTNIEQMIENAKTPADHEAIAKYYDQQGAKAHQEMQWHQKLLKAYMANPRFSTMQMHCSRLVDFYKNEAKEDKKLAQEHREMAKAAESK